jgi:hypothetical protein
MKRFVLRTLIFGAVAAGGILVAGAPAQAAQNSFFNSGPLSGNQFSTVVQVPVNVCGNAIAILGNARAACRGGAFAFNGDRDGASGPTLSSRTWSWFGR